MIKFLDLDDTFLLTMKYSLPRSKEHLYSKVQLIQHYSSNKLSVSHKFSCYLPVFSSKPTSIWKTSWGWLLLRTSPPFSPLIRSVKFNNELSCPWITLCIVNTRPKRFFRCDKGSSYHLRKSIWKKNSKHPEVQIYKKRRENKRKSLLFFFSLILILKWKTFSFFLFNKFPPLYISQEPLKSHQLFEVKADDGVTSAGALGKPIKHKGTIHHPSF